MKRKLAMLATALCCAATILAQAEQTKGPVLKFEKTDNNFGIFDQEHAKQTCYFRFTNTGDENLVITDVYTSCNCTVPEYPKHEIAPGATDSIMVSYDGTGKRPGVFRKIITVNYNGRTADDSYARVTITGEMADKEVVDQITKELEAEYGKKD
ncbi:MAG: DUF1573 domain-containing protein [Bacteroidaceae bacterium]|nr:DUF1573 domain-containing protein [Bacteroidaceae bacterium]